MQYIVKISIKRVNKKKKKNVIFRRIKEMLETKKKKMYFINGTQRVFGNEIKYACKL